MKRAVVVALASIDQAIDEVLHRPAVVKAFKWVPRWWLCDLAKLSVRLDDRWATGYWDLGGVPGRPCQACARRASTCVYGGPDEDEEFGDFLEGLPIHVCSWCHLTGSLWDESDVQRELALARDYSIAWRWRWTVRP